MSKFSCVRVVSLKNDLYLDNGEKFFEIMIEGTINVDNGDYWTAPYTEYIVDTIKFNEDITLKNITYFKGTEVSNKFINDFILDSNYIKNFRDIHTEEMY